MEKTSIFDKLNTWARNSISLKLITIGILILILLIPSSMMNGLIYERQSIRDGAIEEVSAKWGYEQTIGGPILTIPFKSWSKNEKDQCEYSIQYAHFLPEKLNVKGAIKPEKRYRGIYVVILYNALLDVSGNFGVPDFKILNIKQEDLLLENAFISLGITDMKGIKNNIQFVVNAKDKKQFNPGI